MKSARLDQNRSATNSSGFRSQNRNQLRGQRHGQHLWQMPTQPPQQHGTYPANSLASQFAIGMVCLLMLASGCTKRDESLFPISIGPEFTAAEVQAALDAPLAKMDPLTIKEGQFSHHVTTNELAGGAVNAVASEVGQTVISRTEDAVKVTLVIVEKMVEYIENDQNRISSTEFTYEIPKTKMAQTQILEPTSFYQQILRTLWAWLPRRQFKINPSSAVAQLNTNEAGTGYPIYAWEHKEPKALVNGMTSAIKTFSETRNLKVRTLRAGFHSLSTRNQIIDAPLLAQKRTGCGGLAALGCKLKAHYVEFDLVTVTETDTDRVHYEFISSTDAPYLAANLQKCVTLMIPIGSGSMKTLLRQCTTVVDFRSEADPKI
jgi:hypothetical protein